MRFLQPIVNSVLLIEMASNGWLVAGPTAAVDISLVGLPIPNGQATLQEFRADSEHSNACAVWLEMGSPQQPSPEQYRRLERAGELATVSEPALIQIENSEVLLQIDLPRKSVVMLEVEWQDVEQTYARPTPAVP